MKKAMKSTMVVAVLATIIFTILYRTTENSVMLSLAITGGTISYHFVIRYVVAGIFMAWSVIAMPFIPYFSAHWQFSVMVE